MADALPYADVTGELVENLLAAEMEADFLGVPVTELRGVQRACRYHGVPASQYSQDQERAKALGLTVEGLYSTQAVAHASGVDFETFVTRGDQAKRHGLSVVELLDAAQCRQMYPGLKMSEAAELLKRSRRLRVPPEDVVAIDECARQYGVSFDQLLIDQAAAQHRRISLAEFYCHGGPASAGDDTAVRRKKPIKDKPVRSREVNPYKAELEVSQSSPQGDKAGAAAVAASAAAAPITVTVTDNSEKPRGCLMASPRGESPVRRQTTPADASFPDPLLPVLSQVGQPNSGSGLPSHLAAFMVSTPSPSKDSPQDDSVAGSGRSSGDDGKPWDADTAEEDEPSAPPSPFEEEKSPVTPFQWTEGDVIRWVVDVGLGEYAASFSDNLVDGELLLQLTSEQLTSEIGLARPLHQQRFFNRRAKLHAQCIRM